MTAKDLLTGLKPFDSEMLVSAAIDEMEVHCAESFPVVTAGLLAGNVNEAMLMDADESITLGKLLGSIIYPPPLLEEQHLFDCIRIMKASKLDHIAVADNNLIVTGVLSYRDCFDGLNNLLMIGSAGAIIVLEMVPQDYSLSEISRIVEYNDSKILGVSLAEKSGSNLLEVHIKLNTTHITNILTSFDRYKYTVKQYFSREDMAEDLQDRYESFLKYLDI